MEYVETKMPDAELEVTRAINKVQSYKEQVVAIRRAIGRIANRLLGSEPENDTTEPSSCADGEIHQLHFNLEELQRELDSLDQQVSRLEIV